MNPFSKDQSQIDIENKKSELRDKYKLNDYENSLLFKVTSLDELNKFEEELKLYRESKKNGSKEIENTLNSINVFDNSKDPLEINPDELDKMMSYKTTSDQQKEVSKAVSSARKQMILDETTSFVTKRNRRLSNGQLDFFVSSDDLKIIERNAEERLSKMQKEAGVRDADKLSDVVNTLNDMSVESRYRYEGYKELVCNDFGITPESFDEWYRAILDENTDRLITEGIKNKTDLYKVSDLQKKYKHLLRKVDGWKKGDIVYKSEFNAKVSELDAEELKRAEKTATPEGKKLFKEMLADTFHSPDNPVKLKQGSVSKDDVGYFLRNRTSKKKVEEVKTSVEKPVEEHRIINLDELIEPKDVKPDKSRVMIHMDYPEHMTKDKIEDDLRRSNVIPYEEPSFKLDVEVVHDIEKELVTEEAIKVAEVISEEDPVLRKYLNMGLTREQAELLAFNEMSEKDKSDKEFKRDKAIREFMNKGLTEEQAKLLVDTHTDPSKSSSDTPKTAIEEVVEEEPIKTREPRIKPNRGVIDDYSKFEETEADPSILRHGSNRLEALKRYKESAKRGRRLFLPNSNYEVFVKKIKSTESIGYMVTLLNNMKDVNLVEAYIKTELLRVCYENIEFDFREEVTYDDFVRCLHESDMTILMLMLALVNIPEDKDGKIPLEIKSLMCTNPDCGAIGHFKDSIKLDLKEEFVNIYPVELYAAQYNNYKNANYETIYHAYRGGAIGKMARHTVKDDMLSYEFIVSAPTVYKTQAIKGSRDEVSYKRVLDRVSDKIDLYKASNDDYINVKDYMESHTFQDYSREMSQLAMNMIDADDNHKRMLTIIADEIDFIRKNDLPWYLIMDTIDQINVTTLDGEEVVSNLDQKDVYTMIGILEQCPKDMLDIVIKTKNDTLEASYPVDIEFSAEDVAGKFDFDGYYGTDDEVREEIKRRNEGKGLSEEKLNDMIESQLKSRAEVKPDYNEKGICFCKNNKWKLNYTAILFFWTSNQSQIAVS